MRIVLSTSPIFRPVSGRIGTSSTGKGLRRDAHPFAAGCRRSLTTQPLWLSGWKRVAAKARTCQHRTCPTPTTITATPALPRMEVLPVTQVLPLTEVLHPTEVSPVQPKIRMEVTRIHLRGRVPHLRHRKLAAAVTATRRHRKLAAAVTATLAVRRQRVHPYVGAHRVHVGKLCGSHTPAPAVGRGDAATNTLRSCLWSSASTP